MTLPLAIAAFDALKDAVGGSLWTYPAIVGAVALDSVVPVAPGEAVVITAGILAADGELSIVLVLVAAALGGMLGDNLCFWLGATLGQRAERRLFGSERGRRRIAWARRQLEQRGGMIIVTARFVPGGRTATTFVSGALEMPWRRFVAIDALAASLWAVYVTALGYFGGATFEESLWKPLLAAGLVALAVSASAEALRRLRLD
ncbi:MAG TPA: DedA family protein [Solirubrobacterales bacterium]|nr:DedA family protein [Solirubrobacterales bacterium]